MDVANVNLDEQFEVTSKAKAKTFMAIAVGVVLLTIGIIGLAQGWETFDPALGGHGHDAHVEASAPAHGEAVEHTESHGHEAESKAEAHGESHGHGEHADHGYSWGKRIKTNIWHNNMFFMGLGIIGVFFLAINYVSWAGWSANLLRVMLAFGWFVPVAGVLIVISFFLFGHDLFHWTHEGIMDPESPLYDKIIASKEWYLGTGFYVLRLIAYPLLWTLFFFFLYKKQKMIDESSALELHSSTINWSGAFIVVFAVTSSMSAWDWIMSIDTHWFSTMFGWYVFASWFVSGLSAMTLTVILLKKNGYMKYVNEEHLHDMGKFMFAFSIFWSYIWFSQFILYWYSNIPEETIWFVERMFMNMGNYAPIFVLNLLINFLFPFLFLMTRDAKRQMTLLQVAAVGLLIGHWFDFYLMISPAVLKEHGGLSLGTLFVELGMFMIYAGVFILVVMFGLSKLKLVAKNHPFIEESLHHHT